MRYNEFRIINEARGLTARTPGEVYVNRQNPNHTLTLQNIEVLAPEGTDGFETNDELMAAIQQKVGDSYNADNKPTRSSTAAIIANFHDDQNQDHTWIRFINKIPPQGVHGTWSTPNTSLFLKQYQYGKSAKQESVPIKPSDIITDENPRDAQTLANEVKQRVAQQLAGTEHEALVEVMNQAVDLALAGKVAPIANPGPYASVLAKYGGEYLGPIAVLGGGITNGDIGKMMQVLNIDTLVGGQVIFPQNTTEELIDSYFILPNGTRLGVSTKIAQGSGAASSMKGVADQLNEEIVQAHPRGAEIIRLLGTKSAMDGPLLVAKMFNIIDQNDINALAAVSKTSRDINDIQSERLRQMTAAQGIAKGSASDPSYRTRWHAITAVVNAMIPEVNADQDFRDACLAALNNNNYLQLLTDLKKSGDSITIDYFGKFPIVYKGNPKLENKTYFATGQKGRIGFKLK